MSEEVAEPLPRSNPIPEAQSQPDQCPVCRSSRYLNRNMRFMVNPECYHRMCETCVDRLFHSGPRLCPIPSCGRTLRRQKFRFQTFDDIRVEREIDIRRRVGQVFNRREEEFDTLADYNNYLTEVEDAIFNLINLVDVPQTERRLREYEQANRAAILENESRARQEADFVRRQEEIEHEQARVRRHRAMLELEEERRARTQNKQQVLNMLAHGADASAVLKSSAAAAAAATATAAGSHAVLKRAGAKRAIGGAAGPDGGDPDRPDGGADAFTFAGLKKKTRPGPAGPFDPFGRTKLEPEYHVPLPDYAWDFLDQARTEPAFVAAGTALDQYYLRTMLDGFAGLSIVVEEDPDKKEAEAAVLKGVFA